MVPAETDLPGLPVSILIVDDVAENRTALRAIL